MRPVGSSSDSHLRNVSSDDSISSDDDNRNLVSEDSNRNPAPDDPSLPTEPWPTSDGNELLANLFGKGGTTESETSRKGGDTAVAIFSQLDVWTVFRLRRVSFGVKRAIDENQRVWQHVCAIFFSSHPAVLNRLPNPNEPWKAVFDRLRDTFMRPLRELREPIAILEGSSDYLFEIRSRIWDAVEQGLERVVYDWFQLLYVHNSLTHIAGPLLELSPRRPNTLLQRALMHRQPHILWTVIAIKNPHSAQGATVIFASDAWTNYVADRDAMTMFSEVGLRPGVEEIEETMNFRHTLRPDQFVWMLETGIVDPRNCPMVNGFNLVSVVSMNQDSKYLEYYIEAYGDVSALNGLPVPNHGDPELGSWLEGSTALHAASYVGNMQAIRQLAAADRSLVDARSHRGLTPLHVAVLYGQCDAIRLLVELGADPNALISHEYTPLHMAVLAQKVAVVEALLGSSADVNLCTLRSGHSTLHFAARDGLPRLVTLLLDWGAHADVAAHRSLTPLHYAASGSSNAHWMMAKDLLSVGANPNAMSAEGFTPFHHAILTGSRAMVKLFLDRESLATPPVNLRACTGQGTLPRALALETENEELIEFFDSRGIVDPELSEESYQGWSAFAESREATDPAASGENSDTQLHLSARDPSPIGLGLTRLLLANRENPNIMGSTGLTPFHLAILSGSREMVELFLHPVSLDAIHVDLTVLPKDGRSLQDLAAQSRSQELVDLFASHEETEGNANN